MRIYFIVFINLTFASGMSHRSIETKLSNFFLLKVLYKWRQTCNARACLSQIFQMMLLLEQCLRLASKGGGGQIDGLLLERFPWNFFDCEWTSRSTLVSIITQFWIKKMCYQKGDIQEGRVESSAVTTELIPRLYKAPRIIPQQKYKYLSATNFTADELFPEIRSNHRNLLSYIT